MLRNRCSFETGGIISFVLWHNLSGKVLTTSKLRKLSLSQSHMLMWFPNTCSYAPPSTWNMQTWDMTTQLRCKIASVDKQKPAKTLCCVLRLLDIWIIVNKSGNWKKGILNVIMHSLIPQLFATLGGKILSMKKWPFSAPVLQRVLAPSPRAVLWCGHPMPCNTYQRKS